MEVVFCGVFAYTTKMALVVREYSLFLSGRFGVATSDSYSVAEHRHWPCGCLVQFI